MELMATSPMEVVNKVFATILQDVLVCCLLKRKCTAFHCIN
jgi:hypothetical protein